MPKIANESGRMRLSGDPDLLRFSSEEVTEIIRRAMHHQDNGRDARLTYRELLVIGQDLGVDSDNIRAAIAGFERDRRRERSLNRIRVGFIGHFFIYAAVNLGLILINLGTGLQHPWFIYPLFGWGIGLAAHGAAVYFAHRRAAARAA